MSFVVEEGGALTTIQDAGRFGWQRYGVSPCGFLDWRSAALANILAGNDPGEPLIESTMTGPRLRMEKDMIAAVTGAQAEIRLDGQIFPPYTRLFLKKGQCLSFGSFERGSRLYMAFQGGIAAPLVMGSASTDLRFGMGGLTGKKLKKGDEIFLKSKREEGLGREAFSVEPERFLSSIRLRVILGPQQDVLTAKGWRTFLEEGFVLSPQSDRMGCRLLGRAIEQKGNGNILSEGMATGAIQLPKDGGMILLLGDRQTVGGYAKIAHVIGIDLPKIAQGRPGDVIRFQVVSIQAAQQLYNQQQEELRRLASFFRGTRSVGRNPRNWQRHSISEEILEKQGHLRKN